MGISRNFNAFARDRDQRALDFLEIHPSSAEQLVRAGLFPNVEKSRERLARAVKRGKVKMVDYVQNHQCRDVKLHARFPVHKPQHEYEVTELILGILADTVRRGYLVDERLADAELVINGEQVYLEHDRGTMGYAEITGKGGRMDKYLDCSNKVLWVFSSETRIKGILERTANLPAAFWFSTYEQARQNFHGEIWRNAYGATLRVDRSAKASATRPLDEGTATTRAGTPS